MVTKNMKKALATTLAFSLAFAVVALPANAAKKATIAKKTVKVKVGKSVKITIKNKNKKAKYKFTSNKKAVATVKTNGTVKGIKAGTAKITVKETLNKKTRSLGKVTVKVSAATTENTTPDAPVATATPDAAATATPDATATATPGATATPEPGLTNEVKVEISDATIKDETKYYEDVNGQPEGIETKFEDGMIVSEIGMYTGIIFKNDAKGKDCNAIEIEFASEGDFDFYGFNSEFTDGTGQNADGQSSAKTVKSTNGEFKKMTFTQKDFGMDDDGMYALKIVNMNEHKPIKIKSISFFKK